MNSKNGSNGNNASQPAGSNATPIDGRCSRQVIADG